MPDFEQVLAEERGKSTSKKTVGLAFSGGGIRSATFNLGILQGLARAKLLGKIDYLSTVSGGGYIGAWLVSWIKRADLATVQKKLGDYENNRDEEGPLAESREVNFLRDFSNYLTPRKGLFGADTWAAIATYLRNVLLNQVILISFLGAILLFPWFAGAAMYKLGQLPSVQLYGTIAAAVAATVLLFLAMAWASAQAVRCSTAAANVENKSADQKWVAALVALPLFLSASLTVIVLWRTPAFAQQPPYLWALVGALAYGFAHIIGTGVRVSFANASQSYRRLSTPEKIGIPLTAFAAGAVGGLLLNLCNQTISFWRSSAAGLGGRWHVIGGGPPVLVVAFLLVGALHIGLLKLLIAPEEQEWWGRLGGLLLLGIIAWAAVFALAIFAPYVVGLCFVWVRTKLALLLAWGATTALGLLSGKSAKTSGKGDGNPAFELVAAMSPYIFIVGLLILLSLAAHRLAVWPEAPMQMYWGSANQVTPGWLALSILVLAASALLLSYRVDINIFSMNLLYRNRLIRCYLGASQIDGRRRPNRFTGFDPTDDLFLTDFDSNTGYEGPYPLICTSLNVTHGDRLAWQERKAESFVFTPKYCGFEFPEMKLEATTAPAGGFRPTNEYAYPVDSHSALHTTRGGVHLGTAISISGAAASANMGYHTSPPLAFLMTVFDVRLGWWLPNSRYTNDQLPAKKPEGGPPCSLLYLLNELMASTTDQSRYVYLSDGGHFENLAVYELVRRRCTYIIACDGDADNGMKFEDLGNAIRKCRSDFGVEITVDTAPLKPDAKTKVASAHGVVGTIQYPKGPNGESAFVGHILYIKPTIVEGVPRDVLAYRDNEPLFPDQSTADQWFEESQFESYRMLGQHSFEMLWPDSKRSDKSVDLKDFFSALSA